MKALLAGLAVAGLAAAGLGCASAGAKKAAADNEAWVRTQSVEVRSFATDETFTTRLDGPAQGLGRRVAEHVAKTLRDRQIKASVIKRDAPASAPIVIDGELLDVDGGNQAARWLGVGWVSGAGAVQVAAAGKVTDQTGRTLGDFRVSASGRGGFMGGDAGWMLDECLQEIGSDIAFQVITGQYTTAD